jgi:hypothetical protein
MGHHYLPLPSDAVRRWQAGGPDDYGNPPERTVSDGSGNPCRHCLRDIPAGGGMLILALRPFSGLQPYAETGPVFLCADACPPHDPRNGAPPIVTERHKLLVKGYGRDERIVYGTGAIADCAGMDNHLERLFANAAVEFADLRSASNNCYFCRVVRDGATAAPSSAGRSSARPFSAGPRLLA